MLTRILILVRSKSVTDVKQLSFSSLFHYWLLSTKSNNGNYPFLSPSLYFFFKIKETNECVCYSLTRELEKKFSDRHVLFVASRRILPRASRSNRSRNTLKQKRPRSRTLTAVHDSILTDLVFPVEIVGKRVRTKEDGAKILKVILDEKEKGSVDYRLDTYSEVYKRLTGKGVTFEFPQGGEH